MRRYTKLRKRSKSRRSVLIRENDALMFQLLKIKHGEKCMICEQAKKVGTFHILPKSTAPRLRYAEDNLLLACWFPCHYTWEHKYFQARGVEKRIKEIRGEDYEQRLRALNAISPPLNTFMLSKLKFALEHFVKHGEMR